MVASPARISVSRVAQLIGRHPATVRRMANSGQIPSAAMIGGQISFNAEAVNAWIEERQDAWQASISAKTSGGVDSGTEDENTAQLYEQLLKLKPAES